MTRVLEYLEVIGVNGGPVYQCRKCQHVLGPATVSFKELAASYETPASEGQPARMSTPANQDWVLRHFICPQCAVLLEVEMLPPGADSVDSASVV